MENIDILDMFEALGDFVSSPEDKDALQKVNDYKSKLVIRNFLPLAQKERVMQKTLYDIRAIDTEAYHFTTALEVSLTFNGLLAYVVNIDYAVYETLKDEVFYDLLWGSGLGDYILGFCSKDFDRVKQMVYNMISFENLKELLSQLSEMTPDSIDRLTNAFKEFEVKGNTAFIRNLADISRHNDPLLTKVKDNVVEGAWREVAEAQRRKKTQTKAKEVQESNDGVDPEDKKE